MVNSIKNELLQQKKMQMKGNLYHYTQVNFAYNSNKMEGSRLSSDQTERIFETHSLFAENEMVKVDDIIEAENHFKLFDYMLDHVDDTLDLEMIIKMNVILKKNTTYESDPRYNVGGLKKYPNMIGIVNVMHTSSQEDVEKDMNALLRDYISKKEVTIQDIIDFHLHFERIRPFGDGNGRVGRMIMFKECLKNNLIPFIIMDEDKPFYLRGLKEYDKDKQFLIETCLCEQDQYEEVFHRFLPKKTD